MSKLLQIYLKKSYASTHGVAFFLTLEKKEKEEEKSTRRGVSRIHNTHHVYH